MPCPNGTNPQSRTGEARRRRRGFPRLAAFVIAALVVLATLWWILSRSSSDRITRRGLELLGNAGSVAEVDAALRRWEQETGTGWRDNPRALARHLLDKYALSDPHVRTLLVRITNVDFGDRAPDWRAWLKAQEQAGAGLQSRSGSRQTIDPNAAWTAPIGLTAWYSTILPLDGQIYIASAGSKLGESDPADGVVRIDGRTGASELIFSFPGSAAGDVLGLSAGDDCLFVACRNGAVYCIAPSGELRWSGSSGSLLASVPLSIDSNRDGTIDVIVVSSDERILAFNGRSGESIWNCRMDARLRQVPTTAELVQANLAAGDCLGDAAPEIIATFATGAVRVLDPQNGDVRWQTSLTGGAYASALAVSRIDDPSPPAYVADRFGAVWTLSRSARSLDAVQTWRIALRGPASVVASLRTLEGGPDRPRRILACTAGMPDAGDGAVNLLDPGEIYWRYAPGGVIWGTPAVADLDGDGASEIVVVSIEHDPEKKPIGILTVLSSQGRCLQQTAFRAPLECSPVVADVDGDGKLEVLVADQGGVLHCFRTRGFGPVEWGLLGGDPHNTRSAVNAYRFGQAPTGYQWRWRPASAAE